ncbi:hypothetical protein U1872_02085 [Sphingomonas sp. RB3P16]|uniref:hypothetical protein n=1 Tax=Parasphingomonas frigoris TaxID=3096163 RepID=UPI002FC58928
MLDLLYGADCQSINRRGLFGGFVGLCALPGALAAAPARRAEPVSRALAAAGGRDLLTRVRVLSWSGRARMLLGSVPVELMVETRIEPFARARSDSWLVTEGREAARSVMVERDSAFVVQYGAQTPLPPAQAQFERQRLGAYGYLLLAPAFVSASSAQRLNAVRDGYPPIALTLAADGRIATADYAIAAPDPDAAAVRQHFRFTGSVAAQGVRYPRQISVTENGRESLRLTITDFSVDLTAA